MEITLTEEMLDRAIEDREGSIGISSCCIISQHPLISNTKLTRAVTIHGRVLKIGAKARTIIDLFDFRQYDKLRSRLPLTVTLTED